MDRRRRNFEMFMVRASRAMMIAATVAMIIALASGMANGMTNARANSPVFFPSLLFAIIVGCAGCIVRYTFRQRARRMWSDHVAKATWGYFRNEFGEYE